MKVAPRPALALLAWTAYVVVFIGLFAALGVDYDNVSSSTGNVLKAVIIPVGAAVAVMIALTTRWGWWRAVMRDHPIAGHRWMLLIPALMACGIIAGLANVSWDKVDSGIALTLVAGCALVGFGEEICNRGLALVGLRGGLSETQAWLGTCGLFALLHAFNIIVGQSLAITLRQIIFAFLVGSVFYATRRITGLLVVAMALHALWDFSTLVTASATDKAASPTAGGALQSLLLIIAVIVALAAMRTITRTNPATGEPNAAPARG